MTMPLTGAVPTYSSSVKPASTANLATSPDSATGSRATGRTGGSSRCGKRSPACRYAHADGSPPRSQLARVSPAGAGSVPVIAGVPYCPEVELVLGTGAGEPAGLRVGVSPCGEHAGVAGPGRRVRG